MSWTVLAQILGVDLGLASVAAIFASAWVRVNRIDRLENQINELTKLQTKIEILETRTLVVERGIEEIKEILKEMRDRPNV